MEQNSKRYNENLHKGAAGKLYQYGRALRRSATNAEKILWEHLRNRKLNGLKFRRQHPIDKFIADFYCYEKKLIIELDGSVHTGEAAILHDRMRTYELWDSDIRVIRFWNGEVENNIGSVLTVIKEICKD